MNNQAFSICLNSLHLPDKSLDKEVWSGISPESADIIDTLYKKFQFEYSSAANIRSIDSNLNGSIFAICITEGYVLLKVTTDMGKRTVNFTGFLLRSDESLRTAWKLVRWQLLFVCADGWNRTGKVWILPSAINTMASKVKLGQDEQKKLLGIGLEMLKAETPYSFALSNYSRLNMPLQFSSGYALAAQAQSGDNGKTILLGADDVAISKQKVYSQYPYLRYCKLMHTTVKNFIKNYHGADQDIKSTMALYGRDEVWYFEIRSGDMIFQEQLPRDMSAYMSQEGGVRYSDVHTLALRAMSSAEGYFRLCAIARQQQMMEQQAAQQQQQQQQYAPPPQQVPPMQTTRPGNNYMQDVAPDVFNATKNAEEKKKKPEKSGGLFSRFRHKKDD